MNTQKMSGLDRIPMGGRSHLYLPNIVKNVIDLALSSGLLICIVNLTFSITRPSNNP